VDAVLVRCAFRVSLDLYSFVNGTPKANLHFHRILLDHLLKFVLVTDLKVMGNRVSECLRQERVRNKGQLSRFETPRSRHVVRVTLLPISLLTKSPMVLISMTFRQSSRFISHVISSGPTIPAKLAA
jgi:hypothetical protein